MAALGGEMARPPLFQVSGSDDEASALAAATVFLAGETTDRPVDPVIWGDEKQMKRELVAWAKAVASMAAAGKNTSPSTPSKTHRRRSRV
ncbi:unnamed protein product [Urochloa humidicola]